MYKQKYKKRLQTAEIVNLYDNRTAVAYSHGGRTEMEIRTDNGLCGHIAGKV